MDKSERFYERIVLALMLALFSFLMYVTGRSNDSLAGDDIASMDMPKVVFGLLLVLCCVKLAANLMFWAKNRRRADESNAVDRRTYITMALIVAYAILFNVIGFCLSTFLFMLTTAQVLRPSNSWAKATAVGVLVTVGTYVIFGMLFDVYFPEPIIDLIRE